MTALDGLFTKSHFDICIVREIMGNLKLSTDREAFRLLHTLHCVDYNKMRPEMRDLIPQLVNECLLPQQTEHCIATDIALQGVEI